MSAQLSDKVRHRLRRALIILTLIVVCAAILETGVAWWLERSSADRSTALLLDQIENVLVTNSESEAADTEDLKTTYQSYAKTIAYIASARPEIVGDADEMANLCDLMGVDEIHFFDETGTIFATTVPRYLGYSFDSGEQMAYFKPMLADKTLSMCQDVSPNTAEGKSMMYAIAWNPEGTIMAQVGIEPTRLLEELDNHDISNVIGNLPTPEGFAVYVLEPGSNQIIASTDASTIGTEAAAVNNDGAESGSGVIGGGNAPFLYNYRTMDGYVVAATYNMQTNIAALVIPLVTIFIYLLIAGFVIYLLMRKVYINDEEMAQRQIELADAKRRAEAASNAKSSFLFSMSHDIRTPMNAIVGYTDLLEKNLDDREKCHDYLGKLRMSNHFLLSLINDVLEMARIESGKVEVSESVIWTRSLFDEVPLVYQEQMRQKNIAFTCTYDINVPYVYADEVKIREILLNIVSNAYKYTPPGRSVSLASRELPDAEPGYVQIETTVADTGVGMSEEYLPTLFEAFTREHTSTENKIQGTGLGMPIVKRLLDLMGGTITVESTLGQGTTFVVTTRHRVADAPDVEPAEASVAALPSFEGRRVLLAEDNDLNAEIAIEILAEKGLEVERAEDGAVCVEMLTTAGLGYYDVVLMDIQMPRMNGYEATRAIRAMADPDLAGIPIFAMTANAFDEDKKAALEAGMNGHLAKPIDVTALMEALASVLH